VIRAALFLSTFIILFPGQPFSERVLSGSRPELAENQPGGRQVSLWSAAWPRRIAEYTLRDGEWMMRVDDEWFAWANGRLLPEKERSRWTEYSPIPFYNYPLETPPMPVLDDAAAAALRERVRNAEKNPPRRSEAFLSALLKAPDRISTEAMLRKMDVAGFTVTAHAQLAEPLEKVSLSLEALRESDPETAAFLATLAGMNGYNYRYVEGTASRSYHSYGLAVDLIPRSYHGRSAYWQWAMYAGEDWWTIPYEKRWLPPLKVVKAFEEQGFVWGGKWLCFDTMHFEYRPELLLWARRMGDDAVDGDQSDSWMEESSFSAPSWNATASER